MWIHEHCNESLGYANGGEFLEFSSQEGLCSTELMFEETISGYIWFAHCLFSHLI